MRKRLLIGITIVTLFAATAIAYALFPSTNTQPDQDTPIPQVPEGPITAQGTITCIPKRGTGPQTMECALGLKSSDGTYYGLRHLSDHDEQFALVSPEITVEVTGTLVPEIMYGPDGNQYDTIGIIEITTLSEL